MNVSNWLENESSQPYYCVVSAGSKIKLSRLREIGWQRWDPLGLCPHPGVWPDDSADQYDSYLLHASDMMCRGQSRQEAALYLIEIASDHMGLSDVDRDAASAAAAAIAAYLEALPFGPRKVR